MPGPTFLTDSVSQAVDTVFDTAGNGAYKHASPTIANPGGSQPEKAQSVYLYADIAGVPTLVEVDSSGHLIVVGTGVAGTPAGGVLTVQGAATPAVFKSASATATGNTAVWTPTTGKKFRLLRFSIELTANAIQTVAGVITVSFQDATTGIGISKDVYVPTVIIGSAIGVGYESGWISLGDLGILSAAANNVLNVNLTTALTGGNVRVNTAGTEE